MERDSTPSGPWTALHWLAGLGAVAWIAWIVAAPWARATDSAWAPWLYWAFDTVCHQNPERSFHLAGHPLAVCHRCFGLYLGFFAGFAAQGLWSRPREIVLRRPLLILICAAPLLVDALLLPFWGGNVPWSRFVTGFVAAAPVAALAWEGLSQIAQHRTLAAG